MKCLRCQKEIDTLIPERHAENYGRNLWACPNCGKPYYFLRTVVCGEAITDAKEDNWGKPIIQNSSE